ncbi:MAG: FG-GAP repeat protein [Cytophagales bacterium]|nr:FG-GAP repeat protein [Cytophagales bacterium]
MNKFTYILFIAIVVIPTCTAAQMRKGNMLPGKVSTEQFGRNVKISADGTVLAVAAPFNSEHGDENGRIAVFEFDGNNWQMMGNEILPGAKDFFYGEMMELSADGKKLVVASPFGCVSIYDFDGKDWVKSPYKVQLENPTDLIQSISITPDARKMAVSFDCQKHRTVCINLFDFNGIQWLQDGLDLTPSPGEKIYSLSLSLSSNGQVLVAGNHSKDTKELNNAGEVLFYSQEGNQWKQNIKSFFGNASSPNLGSVVQIAKNGDWVIAAGNSVDLLNADAGFVETYEITDHTKLKKLNPLKPESRKSYFGHAIAISADGSRMALSMPYEGYGKPGYVKVYKRALQEWKEVSKIIDVDGVETTALPNNSTGWSIALSADGNTLAVGFPHNDENGDMSGKVVVYDLTSLTQTIDD